MEAYKVYLTRSSEVARLIAAGFISKQQEALPGQSVGFGPADSKAEFVPEVFQEQGYFYCCIKYDSDNPNYELIFA